MKTAEDESRWIAVKNRDRKADGRFVFAVRTTGIFCRPGCPSRTPNRGNVEFFDSAAEAAAQGYRPCKRCRPEVEKPLAKDATSLMEAICRYMDNLEDRPSLKDLAEQADMSADHFQRTFKRIIGISPREYWTSRKANRLLAAVESGTSVTEAVHGTGYSSSSTAYRSVAEVSSLTPRQHREGARGVAIKYIVAGCFLGPVLVAATGKGICAVLFNDDPGELPRDLATRFPGADISEAPAGEAALLNSAVRAVEQPLGAGDLPLDIAGTAFQRLVWKTLRTIPAGSTASYGDIARKIGSPGSSRAVARACASNKIAVLIPCHRIVRKDGTPGGYRWGVERKKALLEREAAGLRD